jgi:peptidoglycan hydrolase-like protein with peptidoglycan-binding domain
MYKRFVRGAIVLGAVAGIIISSVSAIGPAKAAGCPTIRQGSPNKTCVQQAQTKLGKLGFMPSTLATGNFLGVTDKAVRDFQAHTGLAVDGVVGPQTWAKLDSSTVASLSPYGIPPSCLKPGKVVCAGKRLQKLMLFENGKITMTLDARFGDALGAKYATAEGLYSITRKMEIDYAREYNNTRMPFVSYFYNGQGVHYSDAFAAGDTGNTSHGCIRLRDWNGTIALYNATPTGTPVFIWN